MQTKIANKADLKFAAAVLHDARFTADEISFDTLTRTFTLKCWGYQRKAIRSNIAHVYRAYWLSFTNVIECKVDIKEKVVCYELSTFRFNERDSTLDLITHYAVDISLKLEKLEGTLAETNEYCEQ